MAEPCCCGSEQVEIFWLRPDFGWAKCLECGDECPVADEDDDGADS